MIAVLVIAVLIRSQLPGTPEVLGKVSAATGGALPGVLVTSTATEQSTTDASGEFVLRQPGRLVRFSLSGYRPLTLRTEELRKRPLVALQADPDAQWTPPTCQARQRGRLMTGDDMQFIVAPRLQVRRGQDIDYRTNVVCLRKSCLQHGFGPLWSDGMPPWSEFPEGFIELQERDVQWRPDLKGQGREYRSTHLDGTYTRFVGVFGETVAYEHAPKEAAEEFDKIIDSLCWRKP